MSDAYFYHYTSAERYEAILDGSHFGRLGLLPLRRVFTHEIARKCGLPERATTGAAFGLLEPKPGAWLPKRMHNDQNKLLLEGVVKPPTSHTEKMLLLSCRVEEGDDVEVWDYGVYLDRPHYGSKGAQKIFNTLHRAYWNSRVPFASYDGGHLLPEVLCFSDIPPERIKPVKTYESFRHLCNDFRGAAGFELLPPQPQPNEAVLDDFFARGLRKG